MNDFLFHMIQGAPEPVAPFSHAVEADGWVFVTGQMPTLPGDPAAALAEGIAAQTHQVIANLRRVLEGLGLGLADVVRAGAYLTHFDENYALFNEVYRGYFPADSTSIWVSPRFSDRSSTVTCGPMAAPASSPAC